MKDLLTIDQFKKVLPKKHKGNVNQEVIDNINLAIVSTEYAGEIRENLLSYVGVMNDGRFKIENYISAVKYVSHKLHGASNLNSYVMTFPDRYQKLLDKGTSPKDISSYVTAYNKSKLVNLIYEQTLVPTYILNAEIYQRAINVQADLMITANSEKVRTEAANSLLNHLKMPETTKIELDITTKEDKSINELRASTMELVAQQKLMIASNAMTVKEVANTKLVIEDGEILDD